MRLRCWFLIVLGVLLLVPGSVQGLDPFDGSTVTRLFDTDDVNAVVSAPFRAFSTAQPLAVDSRGDVFLMVTAETAGVALFQDVVRYSEDSTGGFTIDSIHRIDVTDFRDGFIKAITMVRADTFDGNGDPLLVQDHLLAVVDGRDTATDTPWREIVMLDPAGVAAPVLVSRAEPGGTVLDNGGLVGRLHLAVDDGGTIYILDVGSGGAADDGNIHRLSFDDVAGEYVDDAIMTTGGADGGVVVRSNGLIYSTAILDGDRKVIEVDPAGTDLVSGYTLDAARVGIVFDSNDRGWMQIGFRNGHGKKATLTMTISEMFEGQAMSQDDRIAESADRFLSWALTADTAGAVYMIQQDVDNGATAADELSIWKIEPDDGSTPPPLPPPPPGGGTISVESVSYAASGGPSGDKHIRVTVAVVDEGGVAVEGASVSFTVTLDGLEYETATETSNSAGEVSVNLRNAPSGDYETTVDNVVASGFTFDGITPANGFTKL